MEALERLTIYGIVLKLLGKWYSKLLDSDKQQLWMQLQSQIQQLLVQMQQLLLPMKQHQLQMQLSFGAIVKSIVSGKIIGCDNNDCKISWLHTKRT